MQKPFEDLERFMDHWQTDPVGLAQFVGRAVARIAHKNYSSLFSSIGASYFSFRNICERIDYLYEHYNSPLGGQKGKLFKQMVALNIRQGSIVCIHDKSGNHNCIRLMLLRYPIKGLPHYSLRCFAEDKKEWTGFLKEVWAQEKGFPSFRAVSSGISQSENSVFWNFRSAIDPLHGVIIYPEADGFANVVETRNVADLILLASNLTGFQV